MTSEDLEPSNTLHTHSHNCKHKMRVNRNYLHTYCIRLQKVANFDPCACVCIEFMSTGINKYMCAVCVCECVQYFDLACASAATIHGGVCPRSDFTQTPIPLMASQEPSCSRAWTTCTSIFQNSGRLWRQRKQDSNTLTHTFNTAHQNSVRCLYLLYRVDLLLVSITRPF